MKSILLCCIVLISIAAAAQNPPTVSAQANTVFVTTEGKYDAEPDTARLQFFIWAQEKVAKDAYARSSAETEQLRQILRTNGIDPKLANIGFFSVQPVYDYRNPKRKIVGYRVSTSVTLKLKDFAKAADIVGTLADQEWAENVSLNYTLENIDAAKIKAVQDALQRAKSEAAAVAQAGGRTLGELTYASVDTFEQVRPMIAPMAQAMTMRAEAAPPAPTAEFTPQTVTVTAHVSTMFALR